MKRITKDMSEKQKEWLWFAGLWSASLATVLLVGYGIKFVIGLI